MSMSKESQELTQGKLLEQYESKLKELNHLLDEGMLSPDEYKELVQDFTDVEAIKADIKEEKLKVFAEMIVNHLATLIKIL
tara:strand:+ start:8930 stop:9172 length:243 start_codon:yes stop_codon:yes gene_type:complete